MGGVHGEGGGHQSLPAAQIGSCLLAPGPGWATNREWRGLGMSCIYQPELPSWEAGDSLRSLPL